VLTQEQIRSLSAANREEGWSAIPASCPDGVRSKICEYRKGVLNGTIRQTKGTKGLHKAAVKAISQSEKMRLRLIEAGIE
jgi:hypothetical protein